MRLTGGLLIVFLSVAFLPVPLHAQGRAPTAIDAKMCRQLAYENYPQQRVGKAPGSGARYQFYRDCIAKRTGSEPPGPPPTPEKPR
jgi:hypothetical protein